MKVFQVVGVFAFLLMAGAAPLRAIADPIDEIRALYLEATEREAGIQRGLDAVAALRSESSPGAVDVALLDAYEGALVALKARYVFWPTTRMRYLNQGLGALDRLVAARPGSSEIRYLRLMSCYYLPSFLGRGSTVREDFSALAQSLPADQENLPSDLYRGIVEFVLDNGRLTPEQTAALRATLR